MDYKKLYEKAVERAKTLTNSGFNDFDFVKHIFPELAESEDEKIRKALIDYFNDFTLPTFEGLEPKKILAWLKKQGEKLPVGFYYVNSEGKKFYSDTFKYGDVILHVEKQGKHKSADKVEPKFKVKYAGCEYNVLEVKDIAGVTYYGIEDEPNHIDYVKADNCKIISGGYGIKENGSPYPTKTAVFSEQKPAWSEEDSPYYDDICEMLINLLHSETADVNKGAVQKDLDWLMSLRPQSTWKPSDKQMEILWKYAEQNNYDGFILTSLHQQLKKLREE